MNTQRRVTSRSPILCSLGVVLSVVTMSGVSIGSAATARGGSVPQGLVGTWGKSISLATWKRHQISDEPAGHYAIKIAASGLTSLYHGNDPTMATVTFAFTTMPAVVSRHTVTFGSTADGVCAGKGTYRWVVTGSKLAFAVVKEGCSPRMVLMTAGTFALEH
jgi:hypothetical protein